MLYTNNMRVKLTYFLGGKTWSEVITANNVTHAKEIGAIRNPRINIIAANPIL